MKWLENKVLQKSYSFFKTVSICRLDKKELNLKKYKILPIFCQYGRNMTNVN